MRIAIISNNTSDIINARGKLIEEMVKKGHEVISIGNEDSNRKKLEKICDIGYRIACEINTNTNYFSKQRR